MGDCNLGREDYAQGDKAADEAADKAADNVGAQVVDQGGAQVADQGGDKARALLARACSIGSSSHTSLSDSSPPRETGGVPVPTLHTATRRLEKRGPSPAFDGAASADETTGITQVETLAAAVGMA